MQEPKYWTVAETRNIAIKKNITIDFKLGERVERAYNDMNEKNFNKTHLHKLYQILLRYQLPGRLVTKNAKLLNRTRNTGMIEVQGQQKYTSLKQIILGLLTLQLSISDWLII